tara:strand:+ start:9764 stop:10105 length:342 start_codon:yes stop_codon:yes gene_type:complete
MSNITILGAYNLGCYSHKGDITFPILADVDGTHLMNYKNKGNYFTNYNLGVNGSGFSVTNIFNEDSTVLMKVTKPDGTLFTYTESGTTYDTFYFQTKIYIHAVNIAEGKVIYK